MARFGLFYLAKNAKKRPAHLHTYTHTVCFLFPGASNHARGSRTSNKVVRCIWVFVCTARFGPFYLAKNAKTEPTHIHTYTHTVCFLFPGLETMLYASLNLGKSTRTQGKYCTFEKFWGPQAMLYASLNSGKSTHTRGKKYSFGLTQCLKMRF